MAKPCKYLDKTTGGCENLKGFKDTDGIYHCSMHPYTTKNCYMKMRKPKPPKSIEIRALELACDSLLKVRFKDVQMTMYEGKWEGMVQDKVAHFMKLAREAK